MPELENQDVLESESVSLYRRVGIGYSDIIVNIDRLIEMIGMYKLKNFEGILSKKYDPKEHGDGPTNVEKVVKKAE